MQGRSDLRFDLILASASPRRRQLLEQIGLVLRLAPTDLDETPQPAEKPGDCVRRLASAKCDASARARWNAAARTETPTPSPKHRPAW
jgi:septum formation protein